MRGMEWANLAAIAALLAAQSFWLTRGLDALGERISDLNTNLSARLAALDARMARVADRTGDLAERLAALEHERSP
jgi:hypothetical protein